MTMFSSLEQSISTDGLGKLTSIDVIKCIIIHVTVG